MSRTMNPALYRNSPNRSRVRLWLETLRIVSLHLCLGALACYLMFDCYPTWYFDFHGFYNTHGLGEYPASYEMIPTGCENLLYLCYILSRIASALSILPALVYLWIEPSRWKRGLFSVATLFACALILLTWEYTEIISNYLD